MAMDQSLRGLYGSVSGLTLNDERIHVLSDQNLVRGFKLDNTFVNQNCINIPALPSDPFLHSPSVSSLSQVGDSHEDFDFSDVILKYISDMLMEEEKEEKTSMFHESSAALEAAEKSLYELIGERYPPSPDHGPVPHFYHKSLQESHDLSTSNLVDPGLSCDLGETRSSRYSSHTASQTCNSSGSNTGMRFDGFMDSPVSTLRISEIFNDSESVIQFKKGFEEASKFIPHGGLFIDSESFGLSLKGLKEDTKEDKAVEKHENKLSSDGSRGKKNPYSEDLNVEVSRGRKQTAVSTESTLSLADFDMVLLNSGQSESALREAFQNEKSKSVQQNAQEKGSDGGKARGKKQGGKRTVVDLRTLLTLCAQAVAADDRRTANDLLKQIRQNASPTGDGMQRLALVLADGLEARLAGSGTQIYTALITKPTSASDVLKAYQLFLAACPFRKLSNFFANKTIMNAAKNARTLHVVDFGILYGFDWPSLIHHLSSRPGGPPKLRITGIDFPQPGFRPAERVEETGRRLANYANRFNVPFEFHPIAQKWDTIQVEDLKINRDEVLAVNCSYRMRNLLDETVVVESPRDSVLKLIRKMNPDVFVNGIVNGAYGVPFFITRFREALYHYSSLFDMLETIVPREIPERTLMEREVFGREAMNVIACEGAERIERPETYKQWQFRTTRAGFRQLPLDKEILATIKARVNELYHKDFVIGEDSHWLLQGWKGRIIYGIAAWKPDG